ncbi:MAG: EamA family transporter [Candidatus Eisenbacteria bacterium]|nr:EamA family transporter [Candidatus Latescibacterota bacterium]MBD3302862.1 EamA family transporter [Candidatus Eisenbacteria bacterium]
MSGIPYIGEIFALAAPICWSIAVILFRKTGETVPALALNLFKNVVSVVLFFGTLYLMGDTLRRDVPTGQYWLLIASGAIGIGLSDTLFFMTLNRVGAALEAIINTSYSPSIIILSFLFLGERLTPLQMLGVLLILSAVLSVGWMRGPGSQEIPRKKLIAGIGFGLLATSTQAVSIVMIKPMLDTTPLIWANCWRLLGGLAMTILLLPLLPQRRAAMRSLRNFKVWPVMVPGTVMGTYISLMFWLAGMKYTLASTASAINQTATLWTFVLAAWWLHEPVTGRRIAGLAAGVVGVALVTFG